jgi:hypothetical protein
VTQVSTPSGSTLLVQRLTIGWRRWGGHRNRA